MPSGNALRPEVQYRLYHTCCIPPNCLRGLTGERVRGESRGLSSFSLVAFVPEGVGSDGEDRGGENVEEVDGRDIEELEVASVAATCSGACVLELFSFSAPAP